MNNIHKIYIFAIHSLEIISLVILSIIISSKAMIIRISFPIVFTIIFVLSNIKLKNATKDLIKKGIEEEREKYLETSLFLEKKRNKELDEDILYIERIKKDIKDRILKAKEYINSKGEIQNAEIEISGATIFSIPTKLYCLNPVIDAVVSSKIKEANAANIQINVDLKVPEKEILSSSELCAIFSNILDNAINACISVEKEKRIISLTSKKANDYWIIICENSYIDKSKIKKENSIINNHGWGLEIIKDIVSRHNGEIQIEKNDDKFIIKLFFNIGNLNN